MTAYRVRQKLVAIGDDFWIENDRGEQIYKVDGKALRLRKTLVFEDADGNELCTIQERKLRIRIAWRSRTLAAGGWQWSRRR
jgi:uncharacterized protein YxjI